VNERSPPKPPSRVEGLLAIHVLPQRCVLSRFVFRSCSRYHETGILKARRRLGQQESGGGCGPCIWSDVRSARGVTSDVGELRLNAAGWSTLVVRSQMGRLSHCR
jgi:hypothetical protein